MRIGVAFPQTRIGTDPVAVRDFAQAAEALGYSHILAYDHVLGANRKTHTDLLGPYSHEDAFYEPFTLFAYLAGVTERIGFATGVIILGQRQTVLVAKQAAVVDVLSGGRLRLGIGIGWNPVEYAALGEDFGNRGRRSEEQVAVLRALWTEELIDFEGKWHRIRDAGLNPLPVQRPIPLWFGGHADRVLERTARLGDGWMQIFYPPDDTFERKRARLYQHAEAAGRDPASIPIESWVSIGKDGPDDWRAEAERWRDLGVRCLTVNTEFHRAHHVRADLNTLDDHLRVIEGYRDSVADLC